MGLLLPLTLSVDGHLHELHEDAHQKFFQNLPLFLEELRKGVTSITRVV